jgi:hypothetical protein
MRVPSHGLELGSVPVLAWLALLVLVAEACGSSSSVSVSAGCAKQDFAYIHSGCVSDQSPVVTTTGPCTATVAGPNGEDLILTGNGAGTCQVERTVTGGAAQSADVNFISAWLPLGTDPHGCGQGFLAVTETGSVCIGCELSVPEFTCDAGSGE